MCRCTIVIPCYNEEARFPTAQFSAFADAHPDIHYILVNDGSRDNTVAVLNAARIGREDRVEVLDLPVNGGKAEAVRQGMLVALARPEPHYAGFWDADLATPLESILELSAVLDANPKLAMVFGARVKLLGRHVERQLLRHYLGRVFATTVSVVLRLPVYDTQCGAKIFRSGPGMRDLFAERFSSRWVFDVEIIARFIRFCGYDLARVEASIYEYPLKQWKDVAGSRVRPKDFFVAFFDVLRIWRRYRQQ